MVMRAKRLLAFGIIPPCLITCVYSCRDGACPVSSPPNGNLKILSDSGRRGTPRLYNRVITVLAPLGYSPSSLRFQEMVIFSNAIFKNIKYCLSR